MPQINSRTDLSPEKEEIKTTTISIMSVNIRNIKLFNNSL